MQDLVPKVMNALETQDIGTLNSLINSQSFPSELPVEEIPSLLEFLAQKLAQKYCRRTLEWLEAALRRHLGPIPHEVCFALRTALLRISANTPKLETLYRINGKLEMLQEPSSSETGSEEDYEDFSENDNEFNSF